jgi:hypothetical protein
MPRRVDREIDLLYGLPEGEFTPARNELAKELKLKGDEGGAERVQALKKPSRAAGAINRAARANRRDVKRLLDAAAKLGRAQERLLQGGGRKSARQAVERERAAVDQLMTAVEAELESGGGGATEAMSGRARGTLHAVASDPELRAELDAGRVSEDRTAVGLGPLTAASDVTRPARPAGSAKKRADARTRLKRAERELEDAERALRRAASEQEAAAERLDAANAAFGRAERELADATGARDEAQAALDGA